MKKIFIGLIGLITGIVIFLPRENLFFLIQKQLKKEKIYINTEIHNNLYLNLTNGTIYYNNMDVAKFEKCSIFPYFLWNSLICNNLKVLKYNIKNLKLTQSIFMPTTIYLKATSDIGNANGKINLLKKEIKIYFSNIKIDDIKNTLKKDNKGYYYYAKF